MPLESMPPDKKGPDGDVGDQVNPHHVAQPLAEQLARLLTAGVGGWLPTDSPPDLPSEGVIDGLPGSVSLPPRKVVVDGPPWGKIVGQRSPDTAIAVAVEDGISALFQNKYSTLTYY